MIYKGVKYACATCIKGHRSSNCNHVERPLFEIRKKGRPVTQCTFCRDLRKTKQVHVKCACTHKMKEQQPIMIYQNSDDQQPIIIDNREKCSCPELNHDHHHHLHSTPSSNHPSDVSTSSLSSSSNNPQQQQQSSSSNNSNNNSGNVTPVNHSSSEIMNNYTSWAVVTPQQEPFLPNQDPVNLGFIFHKPSSQRYLNGQPRPPRKKSIKKQQQQRPPSPHQLTNLTCTTPLSTSSSSSTTTTSTTVPIKNEFLSQQDFILPLMDIDNLPTTTTTNNNNNSNNNNNNNNNNIYDYDSLIPTSTADLNAILNNVLKPMQEEFKSDEEHMNHELANLDLTASSMYNNNNNNNNQTSSRSSSISSPNHSTTINNNNMIPILSSPSNSSTTTNMTTSSSITSTSLNNNNNHHHQQPFFPTITNMPININPAAISSSSSTTTSSTTTTSTSSPFDQISCCNQHHHSSSDGSTGIIGESVVITITPLNESHHPLQGNNNQVRTRIMTCYCGSQCQCTGCLIHPGNFLIGDQYYNPFNGFPTTSSTCPSSTASSTYSVSDDEDHFHLL